MTAIAWSLVGLMAASLGVLATALFSMLNRIDVQGAYLGQRIDAFGAEVRAELAAVRAELADLRAEVWAELRGFRG